MENYNRNSFNPVQNGPAATEIAARTFMANVFALMFGALMVTAITAYCFANFTALHSLMYETVSVNGHLITKFAPLGYVCIFAPFGIILAMGLGYERFSLPLLAFLFVLYSTMTGAFLSVLLLEYSVQTIGSTFAITAGMFGVMAVMGYTTKADLTSFGRLMGMGFVGLCIALIANWFMQSEGLDYLISFAGVAIFTGLTAYKVQALKMIGAGSTSGGTLSMKLAIVGALSLYITFLNLFIFILRLMGGNRR